MKITLNGDTYNSDGKVILKYLKDMYNSLNSVTGTATLECECVDFKKDIEGLKDLVELINSISSTKSSLKDSGLYSYKITIVGKLADVLGTFELFNINESAKEIISYKHVDLSILRNVKSGHRHGITYSNSLLLKYLSDYNSCTDYGHIHNLLFSLNKESGVNEMLEEIFKEIYGVNSDEVIVEDNSDKLSLGNIKKSKMDELEKMMEDIISE